MIERESRGMDVCGCKGWRGCVLKVLQKLWKMCFLFARNSSSVERIYIRSSQTTILQEINVNNNQCSIRCLDSNPRPPDHQPPLITTRLGLQNELMIHSPFNKKLDRLIKQPQNGLAFVKCVLLFMIHHGSRRKSYSKVYADQFYHIWQNTSTFCKILMFLGNM